MRTVGVISDTHGLLREEALAPLADVDHIVHAGDIGGPEILARLRELAPVTAVRGNNDKAPWADDLPICELITMEGRALYVIHDIADLDLDPAAAQIAVVVSGHSHQPIVREHNGVVYLNPGSAGPRRFKLPVSVARLFVSRDTVRAELIELEIRTAPRRRAHAGQRSSSSG